MPALSLTSSSSRLLPSLELATPVPNILSSLFTKDKRRKENYKPTSMVELGRLGCLGSEKIEQGEDEDHD